MGTGSEMVYPPLLAVTFPSATTAGSTANFTVTVGTAFNYGVDTAFTGTVHFTSSDPQAVLPPDYTFTAADLADLLRELLPQMGNKNPVKVIVPGVEEKKPEPPKDKDGKDKSSR
jgi:hypothetical protein